MYFFNKLISIFIKKLLVVDIHNLTIFTSLLVYEKYLLVVDIHKLTIFINY